MFNNWKSFINWEQTTKDTIDVKKTYIDISDDFMSGVLLSQIVYWYLPNKEGKSKLRVKKDGHFWIAKKVEDWHEEIRFSRRNYETAIKKLVEKEIVVKKRFKFNGTPTTHIRLNIPVFLMKLNEVLQSYENNLDHDYDDFDSYLQEEIQSNPLVNMDSHDSAISNRAIRANGKEQTVQIESANRTNENARNEQMKTHESIYSLTENTTKNTTKNITENIYQSSSSIETLQKQDSINLYTIEEEEENNKNIIVNPFVINFLKNELNYSEYIISDIINNMKKYKIESFTKSQLKNQARRIHNWIKKNQTEITEFGYFFVNGILKHEPSRDIIDKEIELNKIAKKQKEEQEITSFINRFTLYEKRYPTDEEIADRENYSPYSTVNYDWIEN
ncbi:hypothetical protein MKX83_24000 [Cytobacillus sp. FSL M8-0252]|uniref:hypothetical protein n=1 Tax=Cytobacillus sp. FSL M8-0252 TaxID=2921621 RepID=UPI0030F6F3DE